MERILEPDSYGFYCKIEVVENEFPGNLSREYVPRESTIVKRERTDPDVPTPCFNRTLKNESLKYLPPPEMESGTLQVNSGTTKSIFNKDSLPDPLLLTNIKNEVDSESVESSLGCSSVIDNVARTIDSVSRVSMSESLGSWSNPIRSYSQTSKTRLKHVKRFKKKKIKPMKNVVVKIEKRGPQYVCNECQRPCASKLGLIRHLSVHFPRVQSYLCSTCSLTFPSSVELKTHVRSHNTCRFCGATFIGVECLDKHVLREHGSSNAEVKSFECDSCSMVFVSKSTLIRHIALHWPIVTEESEDCKRDKLKYISGSRKRFRCDICEPIKKFQTSFTYYSHLRSHYECIHCDRSYLDAQLLDKHTFAIHNDGNELTCERCEKIFIDRRKLTFHVKFAHRNLPFQCSDCEKSFSRLKTLDRHRKLYGGGSNRSCPVCGKHFTRGGGLKAHMPIHDNEHGTEDPVHICGDGYSCKLCHKHFTSRRGYSVHFSSEHIEYDGLFQCTDCPKSFKRISSLRTHEKIHSVTSNDFKHLCSFCGAFFRRHVTLDVHMRTRTVNRGKKGRLPYKCEHCSKSYMLKGSLTRHVEMTHNPNEAKRYSCQNCDKSFYGQYRLKEHSLTHETNREYKFKCQLCEKGYRKKERYAAHLRWHSGENPFKCKYCTKVYNSILSLRRHETTHRNEYTSGPISSFPCPVCNKTFPQLSALNHHRKTQGHDLAETDCEAGAPHKCLECEKQYLSKRSLIRHVKGVHTKIQIQLSFMCEICAVVLSKSSDLRYHKRTKHGERNFRCTECDKAFFTCYHLSEHLKRHREPGFKCSKCGLTYFTSRHLRQHRIRKHSKIKELFICNECNRSISSKSSLVIHLRRHSGIRPFHCRVCYRTFTSNGALKIHTGTHL